jgi:hypothetical protein
MGLAACPSGDRPSCKEFFPQPAAAIAACDSFCVEAVWPKTLHISFVIELQTRQVHLAGVTAHPSPARVTQQACNLARAGSPFFLPTIYQDRPPGKTRRIKAVFRCNIPEKDLDSCLSLGAHVSVCGRVFRSDDGARDDLWLDSAPADSIEGPSPAVLRGGAAEGDETGVKLCPCFLLVPLPDVRVVTPGEGAAERVNPFIGWALL